MAAAPLYRPDGASFLCVLQRFFQSFHEGRDDRDVRVSPWREHPAVGRVRELTFVSPVKMRMGISPSSAHCHQTQRYRVFEGGAHLVLESSQTMNDIPFGDHFTVESRWDFAALPSAPDGAPRTKVGDLLPPATMALHKANGFDVNLSCSKSQTPPMAPPAPRWGTCCLLQRCHYTKQMGLMSI